MAITSQTTHFARDVLGRYVCNTFDEAVASTDTTRRVDARPFDIVIVGGGTFGAALAQHLFFRDKQRRHRILVLEAGPFLIPEHTQNLPMLGLNVAAADHLANLQQGNDPRNPKARAEVWGLAWHSPTKFPGLAYCVGGRSLYWGGWSPQLLSEEMPTQSSARSPWPADVVADLENKFFKQASEQIGVTETNDFIFGPLHETLRKRLFDAIKARKVRGAIPLEDLPLHLDPALIPPGKEDLHKLEAPLAVQANPPRSGFFPLSKFSTVPLLIKAARAAFEESAGDDVKKRLMVVPNCHVKRLVTENGRVVRVETNFGSVPIASNARVAIALGTIESTRLALHSFDGHPGTGPIGQNLIGHLRSNLALRIPRSALPGNLPNELQASALFVKGSAQRSDGSVGYFHLQITAAGLGAVEGNAEAELFQTVPDIDTFGRFRAADDSHVVIQIRGIGEMEPKNAASFVRLDSQTDEWDVPRAFVAIKASANDNELWDAMDRAAEDVATAFAGGSSFERLAFNRDGLGTTHHEAGTMWMGSTAANSVTDSHARVHGIENAYVVGPAVFPSVGSPNPMLTGIALARRLAGHLIPDQVAFRPESGFTALFDALSLSNWQMAGQGHARFIDGSIELTGGTDLGLYWCRTAMPKNYVLRLDWLRHSDADNSGVFVRFPDPNSRGYQNTAYVAVDFGFEVQIDELARPDGADIHRTGAIYNEAAQSYKRVPARAPGQWNEFEIRVDDQTYTVFMNGERVTQFNNTNPARGQPSAPNAPSFVGLQAYPGSRVVFRNIRFMETKAPAPIMAVAGSGNV